MKSNYYVNQIAQSNGDHEVHKETCFNLPAPQHRKYLGEFETCHGAVKKAKESYSTADGCKYCSPDCHLR